MSPFSVASRHHVPQKPGAKLFWMFRPELGRMVFFSAEDRVPGSVEAKELEELYVWEPLHEDPTYCDGCMRVHKRSAAYECQALDAHGRDAGRRTFFCEDHLPRGARLLSVRERVRCSACAQSGDVRQLATAVCQLCRCMLCDDCARRHEHADWCIHARDITAACACEVVDRVEAHVARAKSVLGAHPGEPGYAVAAHIVEILGHGRTRAKLVEYKRLYGERPACDMMLWLLALTQVAFLLDAAVAHPPDRELLSATVTFLASRVRTTDGHPVPARPHSHSSSSTSSRMP